jgi:acetyl-CoA/propionyl-CoA carboxylase carboxyl transferase subunit
MMTVQPSVVRTGVRQPRLDGEGPDPRNPVERLSLLLDRGSIVAVCDRPDGGAYAVRGDIDGHPVVAYCTDATRLRGCLGADDCRRIAEAIDLAVRLRCPVVGLWHFGEQTPAEDIGSLDGMGQMFAAMIRASGRIAQISVVLGPVAGWAAYGVALTDLVVMAPAGLVFVTGPDVTHVLAHSEADATDRARRLAGLLANPGTLDLSATREERDLRLLLPDDPRRAYDMRQVIRALLDPAEPDSLEELQAKWAPNLVTGLGRLGGRTIGVIANNPIRMGGCLDSLSAEKGARFVRMCDALGVPLVVLVDVPGYLPGVRQEWEGVVRRGAKLLHAFGEAVVPRVTLVTRKSYGGAYIARNSRALGATAVLAWPEAEVAVMGAEAAVGIVHRGCWPPPASRSGRGCGPAWSRSTPRGPAA